MENRTSVALASAAAAAVVVVLVLVSSDGSSTPPTPRANPAAPEAAAPATGSRSALEDCSTRSEASFPGAFASPDNLVVGPLVLVGGAYTDAATVREYGGNKFPVLLEAGHTATVRLARSGKEGAGLAYGPLPEGETRLRDTYTSVTFVACRPGRASRQYRSDGPSGSDADGVSVTFWSGFVLTRTPACIPLEVYVDDEPAPRRVELALGRRCPRSPFATRRGGAGATRPAAA